MKDEHPLDPLSRVNERVLNILKEHGLAALDASIVPATRPGGDHGYRLLITLDEDFVPPAPDAQFDQVIADASNAEAEERARKAREELESLRDSLDDPSKGIGLD